MDRAGFWRASVSSAAACVAASVGGRIENFFCNGHSFAVSDTCFDNFLGMYVAHCATRALDTRTSSL